MNNPRLYFDGKEYGLDKDFIFPAGEVQIRLPDVKGKVSEIVVDIRIRSSDDIMKVLLIDDALYRMYPTITTILKLMYLPYARQDRVCYRGEAYSKSVIMDLLNSTSFDKITIADIHSEKDRLYIHEQEEITSLDIFKQNKDILDNIDLLICPDKGALEKVTSIASYFDKPVVIADKNRNPDTGNIEGILLVEEHLDKIKGNNLLIIDDLCDGGYTFELLAKELNKHNPKNIGLYVTHGIFSKGFTGLLEAGISQFITTNSYYYAQFLEDIDDIKVINL